MLFNKDSSHKRRFFDPALTQTTRVIWIGSTSIHANEAKLEIYKRYENDLISNDILLHHEFEDKDEICKRSALQRLGYLSKVVIAITKCVPLDSLRRVLQSVTEHELSLKNLRYICNKSYLKAGDHFRSESLSSSLDMQTLRTLLKPVFEEVAKSFEIKLLQEISKITEVKFETYFKHTDFKLDTSVDAFQGLRNDVKDAINQFLLETILSLKEHRPLVLSQKQNLNEKLRREQVAGFLHETLLPMKTAIIAELFRRISGVFQRTQDGLRRISTHIDYFTNQIAISDQQTRKITNSIAFIIFYLFILRLLIRFNILIRNV